MTDYLFTDQEQQQILDAIKAAELNTSGEIRVHIEKECKENVLDHAAFIFDELQMEKTKLRNGVLFYIAVEDRKFAILGDIGINKKVPNNFWDKINEQVLSQFKKEQFVKGLSEGIKMAGEQLKQHFPYQSDDENELLDEISFGK